MVEACRRGIGSGPHSRCLRDKLALCFGRKGYSFSRRRSECLAGIAGMRREQDWRGGGELKWVESIDGFDEHLDGTGGEI